MLELQQNPQRYSNTASGVTTISAQSEALGGVTIPPIVLEEVGEDIRLETGLDSSIKGLVIYIEDLNKYITSSETVSILEDAITLNPHYTYKELSSVMGAKMGKTIPFIKVSLNSIISEVVKQKEKIKFAGVKSVVWSYESPSEEVGLLLNQINWTLSNSSPKPLDTFSTYDLNLSGDYSITSLPIVPLDKDAKIPEETLTKNLETINSRLVELRKDFNSIKSLFYFGIQPSDAVTRHTILAAADEGDDIEVQVVTKDTTMVSNQTPPSNQLAEAAAEAVKSVTDRVEQSQATLQQKINETEQTIRTAQSGDSQAQEALRRQVSEAQSQASKATDSLIQRLRSKGINLD